MKKLIALCTVLALAGMANAAVLYQADFESYDTSAGAVNVTVNTTGDDDTLSVVQTGMEAQAVTGAFDGRGPLNDDNYLAVWRSDQGTGKIHLEVKQLYADDFDAGEGVRILSYDLQRLGV